jgi:sarcosine oxidase
VLGIDQFTPPHRFGSSHGETCITRLSIGEGEHYTPLVLRSHELWREIEKETGADLLTVTAALSSPASRGPRCCMSTSSSNTVAAAGEISHPASDAERTRHQNTIFAIPCATTSRAYYEPERAGFLRLEAAPRTGLPGIWRH